MTIKFRAENNDAEFYFVINAIIQAIQNSHCFGREKVYSQNKLFQLNLKMKLLVSDDMMFKPEPSRRQSF